jgi:hypothetical protein
VSWHDYPLTVREIAAFPACRSESQKQPSLSNFSRRAPAPTKDPASAWLAQKWHAAAPGPRQAGLPLDLAEELWGFTLDCGPNRRVWAHDTTPLRGSTSEGSRERLAASGDEVGGVIQSYPQHRFRVRRGSRMYVDSNGRFTGAQTNAYADAPYTKTVLKVNLTEIFNALRQ